MHSIAAASLALVLGTLPGAAPAQDRWPSKPIRMIVPFTPGSASDVLGRIVGQRVSEIYGQQFVIDNRPGAGGLIGSVLTRQAAEPGFGPPEHFDKMQRDEYVELSALIKESGMKVQ